MKKIHIGPLPPPYGGISVYLYRLSKLEKESEFINENKFIGKKKLRFWIFKQIFSKKKKNYVIHSMLLRNQLIFYLLSLISFHKYSLVIHGKQLIIQYFNLCSLKRILIKNMLNIAVFIQVVNPTYKFFLERFGVKNKRIIVKNAFLPPPVEEEKHILKSYEKELIEFIHNRTPKIIINAHALYFFNNVDLYGLDLSIELLSFLKTDYPNIGLIFALANDNINPDYFIQMKKKIRNLNIDKNFFFLIGNKEIWPLFKRVDLMIRPTILDGDSISIREALYFKIPVIASDVTTRPSNVILFKNRDISELLKKSINLLKGNNSKH